MSLEQVALSPQCGFSPTVHGNDGSRGQLKLVIDIARDEWGEIWLFGPRDR